jgi:hypothetical protein
MPFTRRHLLFATLAALPAWLAPARARAAWTEEHADFPFVLRADAKLPNAPSILSELQELQEDLVKTLGIDPAADWIEIYIYRDRAALDRFTADLLPDSEPRPALFVQGRGPAMVLTYRGDNLAVDLRHETTHALLHQYVENLPLWLDEGLAEYFEEPVDRRRDHHAHLSALREPGAIDDLPSLTQIEAKSDLSELALRDYQAAWAWTHYLLHGPLVLRAELRAYLADSAEDRSKRSLRNRLLRLDPQIERQQSAALRSQLEKAAP